MHISANSLCFMQIFYCFSVHRAPISSLSSKFQMTLDKIELRVLIRYCWKRQLSTRDAAKEICDAEGEGTVHYTTVSRWYKRFDSGDLNLEDQPRAGRPPTLDNEDLRAALEDEPSSSSRELASALGISSHRTVLNHLHQMDFMHKKPRQDPHELTEAQAKRRVEVCLQLLENPLDDRFWKRIVTSDEKWVYLVNHNRQKRWVPRGQNPPSVPRQDRLGKKVMICVWWNFEGVLHFELVPDGRTVNAELYCQQLDCVYDKLKEKYPIAVRRTRALFQQDNAKPHTAKKTKEKFDELEEVEVLPHPAYSPDIAPSDYGLFRSMQHFLRGRRFESFDEVEEACWEFFDSKPAEWYFNQIRMLADRWQKIVENDGLYFEE
jgi:histone-lysine N-methyltransferase SETMAR